MGGFSCNGRLCSEMQLQASAICLVLTLGERKITSNKTGFNL